MFGGCRLSRPTNRALFSLKRQHNRRLSAGAPLDGGSTAVVLKKTLHRSCQLPLEHATVVPITNAPEKKITIVALLELLKNYHALLGAIQERRLNSKKYGSSPRVRVFTTTSVRLCRLCGTSVVFQACSVSLQGRCNKN